MDSFVDILGAYKNGASVFMWVSRPLNMSVAQIQNDRPTPNQHKLEVLNSRKIAELVTKVAKQKNVPRGSVVEQVKAILDEIGYNMQIKTLRWLGLLLSKICVRATSGIFVNEARILKLKNVMGDTPIIYVPSHRSYADFILMSYVLFTYDIEIPAIAAGMDFHGMWGMGSMLRDTGAFFMRRSYNDDPLYWDTFKQYVYQLVTRGENGLEFFIEGTRSRSNKSLPPKFGLLTMILRAFFNADVPDILFCPINITYDRILEEKLFAFELLGVPKPKESTSGFFKSLSIIKENYGKYYVNFGELISTKEYFGTAANRSDHNIKPKHLQSTTELERKLTSLLAKEIIFDQQKLCVITLFNLIAIATSTYLLSNEKMHLHKLKQCVDTLKTVFSTFGACLETEIFSQKAIMESLNVHKNVLAVNAENCVSFVHNEVVFDKRNIDKLKGHNLNDQTMEYAIPFIMLQLYVNPSLHYLIDSIIVTNILANTSENSILKNDLLQEYHFLRELFKEEFVTGNSNVIMEFDSTLEKMHFLELIEVQNEQVTLNSNNILTEMFTCLLHPFLVTYCTVVQVLLESNSEVELKEKSILQKSQSKIEDLIESETGNIHPYALSLDSMQNCFLSLQSLGCISKIRINSGVCYQKNQIKLQELQAMVNKYVPTFELNKLKNKL